MISFASLIIGVVYVAHTMGCVWIYLGKAEPCKIDDDLIQDLDTNLKEDCTVSWVYANDFEEKSYGT